MRTVLVLNAGSSSLKFVLFASDDGRLDRLVHGSARRLCLENPIASITVADATTEQTLAPGDDHCQVLDIFLDECRRLGRDIDSVGHRVVHGGGLFAGPTRIDPDVLATLRTFISLAPLHQPIQLRLIDDLLDRFPEAPQVACFDTAIHGSMPEVAARFPLPKWVWEQGIRRYGFHGLSYESVLSSLPELTRGKTLIAHLGNGASAAAFLNGRSIDTTMGFTPAGGMMMGTRCGDLDPGVLLHLLRECDLSAADLGRLVNEESGLLGVSGVTSDMETLLDKGDAESRLAVDTFCLLAAKQLAGLVVSLGGIDRLVFTGGIGENSPVIRQMLCDRLGFLGITLDPAANAASAEIISDRRGRPEVFVIRTDEERLIGLQTAELTGLTE